jgi:soluble lytic murein transglycosylase
LLLALALRSLAGQDGALRLTPTNHPILSRDLSQLWLAPVVVRPLPTIGAVGEFAAAMKLADEESYDKALPILARPAVQQGPLGDYAAYYAAVAVLRLGQPADARRSLRALQLRQPVGYLAEAAALAEAECAEALGDYAGAADIYERLSRQPNTAPDDVLMRLAGAARAAGDTPRAVEALTRLRFEFPLSDQASLAEQEYIALAGPPTIPAGSALYTRELTRAGQLYAAGQWAEARRAFEAIAPAAPAGDRDLIQLRLGECDYFLKRLRPARDWLRPLTERGTHRAEALHMWSSAVRDLGDHAAYVRTARRVAAEFPASPWAEDALNGLATHFIVNNQDAEADGVLRELHARAPGGRFAERAAWRIGWRAYRARRYAEAVRYFDDAAARFPRSDYRPPWLYWSGRAHEALGYTALADERFALVAADYLNSYYGRLATERRGGRLPAPRVVADTPAPSPERRPNDPVIRALLDLQRFDDALNELRYARQVWGDTPAIQATISWIYRQQGLAASGPDRFTLLRGSITAMRRVYPQFMAAGGERLPREVLTLIFPLAYWDLIEKYAAQNRLDPYLVAALMAQESTFVDDVRSPSGAVGLMQLMPATARQVARALNITYAPSLLTDPEANVRMGTAYLADKVREFGELHLALAAYNAGETPVRRWRSERPGVPRDEFIDDIPYPETQNYVKRILGTAENYRRLYGS